MRPDFNWNKQPARQSGIGDEEQVHRCSPVCHADIAARKLVEIANDVEPEQDGRIYIERANAPFLAADGTGIERAIPLGWLRESGTYLKFTDSGAALFA